MVSNSVIRVDGSNRFIPNLHVTFHHLEKPVTYKFVPLKH